MPTRDEQFEKWSNSPAISKIANENYGNELGAPQRMIDACLRAAFDGGYQACLDEVRSKLRTLGTDHEKPARPAGSESANDAGPDKTL
ncbi:MULTISPECIES: hypothetical protein [unclassified Variovorax]|uniref:hypothetical protein n=1 Tax=unclassified Variovorax TaxID=663243 RepID=UPI003F45D8B2